MVLEIPLSTDRFTTITIQNKDNTKRVVKAIGLYDYNTALKLAKDLEGDNFLKIISFV